MALCVVCLMCQNPTHSTAHPELAVLPDGDPPIAACGELLVQQLADRVIHPVLQPATTRVHTAPWLDSIGIPAYGLSS